MSRKTDQLKKNVEINTARSIQGWQKDNKTKAPEKVKRKFQKDFQDSANRVEKQLATVWNPKESKPIPDGNRPMFGTYFGGVEFDKKGNIIR